MKQIAPPNLSHPKRELRKQLEPLLEKLIGNLLVNVPEKKLKKQVKKAAAQLSDELAQFSKPIAKKEIKPAKVVKKTVKGKNDKVASTTKVKGKLTAAKIAPKKLK